MWSCLASSSSNMRVHGKMQTYSMMLFKTNLYLSVAILISHAQFYEIQNEASVQNGLGQFHRADEIALIPEIFA